MFGTAITCPLTWDKMELSRSEKLSEAFQATQPITKNLYE